MPEEAKTPAQTMNEAVEVAMMFAMLAAQGHKDVAEYRSVLSSTFIQFLGGMGYVVAEKPNGLG